MVKEQKQIKYDSANKVLKMLGVESMESIDNNSIKRLALLFPKMDHELAKSLIEQTPDFCHVAEVIATTYKELAIKAMENDDSYTELYIEQCESVINDFIKDKNSEEISLEEKDKIADRILQVMEFERNIIEGSREYKLANQRFSAGFLASLFLILVSTVTAFAIQRSNSDDTDKEELICENEDEDYE